MTDKSTHQETKTVANFLKKLKPGKLPLPIFLQVARLTVTPIVEVVPLRKTSKSVEVLLTKRGVDDPIWPGMYHTPGTVVRATDHEGNYNDAFRRIFEDELQRTSVGKPVFVTNLLRKVKRGMESSLIYWVEVTGQPKVGKFFALDHLPKNIIKTQIGFIQKATEDFLKSNH